MERQWRAVRQGQSSNHRRRERVPRDTIAARLRDLDRISTPEGIEKLEQLDVNGSKQWISIRGLNRANPILLVLHGGPGDGSWYGKKDLSFEEPGRFLLTLVNVVLPLAGGSPGQ